MQFLHWCSYGHRSFEQNIASHKWCFPQLQLRAGLSHLSRQILSNHCVAMFCGLVDGIHFIASVFCLFFFWRAATGTALLPGDNFDVNHHSRKLQNVSGLAKIYVRCYWLGLSSRGWGGAQYQKRNYFSSLWKCVSKSSKHRTYEHLDNRKKSIRPIEKDSDQSGLGSDSPQPNLPHPNFFLGPNRRSPICRARFAGAQFAAAPKSSGPSLPPNRQGAQFA